MTGGFQPEAHHVATHVVTNHAVNISGTTGSYSQPSQQSYSAASGPPEQLMYYQHQKHAQYPLVSTVEEMAELQQDLIEENSRLRHEV